MVGDRAHRGEKSMRTLIAATAILIGCAVPNYMEYSESQLDRIIVTPADISRPYEILGSVDWPGRGVIVISSDPICGPDRIRGEALDRYGEGVDAVIGFTTWHDGSQHNCNGTAVRFIDSEP